MKTLSSSRKEEIKKFINRRIDSIMDWYTHAEAVDCAETRKNINKDLDSILPEVEKKFNLKKIDMVIRVRSSETPGIFRICVEKLTVC